MENIIKKNIYEIQSELKKIHNKNKKIKIIINKIDENYL